MNNPWRAMRESIPNLSQREVGRRANINSGRLSIIERGVEPTLDEADRLRSVLWTAALQAGAVVSSDELLEKGPDARLVKDGGKP